MSIHVTESPRIDPIDSRQQQHVVNLTCDYIRQAEVLFDRAFDPVEVLFDLRGQSAGMYRIKNGVRHIRYNPWLFAKYYDANLAQTVPHEVAHYITERLYGLRSVLPHGKQWQSVMRAFGVEPVRTCRFDMTGIPVRQVRRFKYRCQCAEHELTSRRHSQVLQGRAFYQCKQCGERLMSL